MENNLPHISTSGYLPSGARVFFTIPLTEPMNAYAEAKVFTDKLLADGLLLHEPGLEPGEIKEQVGYIARRQKKNDDGTVTPVIDLYSPHDGMRFKYLSVYLNTPDDVAAFENAIGLKFAALPLVSGKASLERGADDDTDKSIIRVANPSLFVIMKPNPRYDEAVEKVKPINERVPKRLFVRWEYTGEITRQQLPPPAPPATQQPEPAQNGATGQPEGKKWPEYEPDDFGLTKEQWNVYLSNGGYTFLWPVINKKLAAMKWYANDYEATNSFKKMQTTGKVDNDKLTVAGALELIYHHCLETGRLQAT